MKVAGKHFQGHERIANRRKISCLHIKKLRIASIICIKKGNIKSTT